MAVGAHQCIWIGEQSVFVGLLPHHLRQIFQVDLVADTRTRGYDPEVVESALAPFQELVALEITLHLHGNVLLKCSVTAKLIDANGVVDDQVNW